MRLDTSTLLRSESRELDLGNVRTSENFRHDFASTFFVPPLFVIPETRVRLDYLISASSTRTVLGRGKFDRHPAQVFGISLLKPHFGSTDLWSWLMIQYLLEIGKSPHRWHSKAWGQRLQLRQHVRAVKNWWKCTSDQQAPINYCPGPEASEMRSNERVYFHLCLEITHSVFTLLPQQCLTDTTWPYFPSSTLAAEHSPPNERLFICNSIIRTSNER